MFLVSKFKVIPYYAHRSTSSTLPSSALASSSALAVLPDVASSVVSTTTNSEINSMDFDNKIAVLERSFTKSLHDARKRVRGDDILMDDLCDKVKTALNLVDGIGNRSIYSARQF
jgi:hypothetical protein